MPHLARLSRIGANDGSKKLTRPYINQSVDQLEVEFEKAHEKTDRDTLELLAHELSFRKMPRARELAHAVGEQLKNPTKPSPESAKHKSESAKRESSRQEEQPRSERQNSRTQSKSRPGPTYPPTPEQIEAINHFKSGGSLKVNAFAGTGKTSTLEFLAQNTPRRGQYIAFNRSIVKDAKDKFPDTVNCATTHGMAARATPSKYRSNRDKMFGKVNANQLAEILGLKKNWRIDKDHVLQPRSQGFLILDTVRRFAQSAEFEPLVEHVPRHGSLLAAPESTIAAVNEFALRGAKVVWDKMCDENDPLPLGHDGYLKLWALSEPKIGADYIMLDEAQDTNPVVLDVLQKQKTQMVYVGDKYQQIYEWRGAINAMERIATDHATNLTTSFRFGEAIADGASKVLSLLGEHVRLTGNPNIKSRIGPVDSGTILARTNSSTITAVIESLDLEKHPHLVGGNTETMELLRGVRDLKNDEPSIVPDFFGFANWNEVVEFAKSGEGQHLQTFVNLVETRGENQLMWALNRTVDEDRSNVIISTAHKAKGREWRYVRLMDDFLKSQLKKDNDPKKFASTGGFDPAELRLFYVAMTRAKEAVEVPEHILPLLGMKAQPQPVRESAKWAPPPHRAATPREAPAPSQASEKVVPTNFTREARAAGPQQQKPEWTPPRDWQPAPPPVRSAPTQVFKPAAPKPAKRKGLLGWLFD